MSPMYPGYWKRMATVGVLSMVLIGAWNAFEWFKMMGWWRA